MTEIGREQLVGHLWGIVDDLEAAGDELDALAITVEASFDSTLREVYAVVTVGGPHIEVALWVGQVAATGRARSTRCPSSTTTPRHRCTTWGAD